jgi:hypothetical protein
MKKRNPADTHAEEWLGTQKELSEGRRLFDIALVVVLSAMILVGGILIFVLPSKDFSQEENRMLTTFPKFSFESLLSGEFTADIGSFYSDQFPFRDALVGFKANLELALLRCENNGVLVGEDGYLIDRLEYSEAEYKNLESGLRAIDKFIEYCEENGYSAELALMPRAIDVMQSKIHPFFDTTRADAAWNIVRSASVSYVDVLPELRARAEDGEYVWYKTDHHYTTLGAYYVYLALGKTLGYTPVSLDHFDKYTASESFHGTTYSASGIKWADYDTVEFYRYGGDTEVKLFDSLGNEIESDGFYVKSYLEKKDKYSAFLGGNSARLSIKHTDGKERPTLLIVKDSFSHAIVPFLAIHFDIELVDMRYYKSSAAKLALELAPDRVLVFYGIDTLASSDEATRLGIISKG